MAGRDGTGVMSVSYPDFQAGAVIVDTQVDANFSDICTEITNSIPRDGQAAPTANIPFGGNKITGLGAGTAATDSANLGQIQAQAYVWGGTAGGTGDAITLTPSPPITAYAAGQSFRFIASAANTTAVTIAINGLTTKAIKKTSGGVAAALVADDIAAGAIVKITYDGTQFRLDDSQLIPASRLAKEGTSGQLLMSNGTSTAPSYQWLSTFFEQVKTTVFTSSGTYTPTSGILYAIIECVGGGGAGGGAAITSGSQYSAGAGGGGGGYSRKVVSAATIGASQTVTIGDGGTAVSGDNGGNGGDTSVGSLCIGKGGTGGAKMTAISSSGSVAGGAGGVTGTGDISIPGESGAYGWVTAGSMNEAGRGGNSILGMGANGSNLNSAAGTAGSLYGGGGAGGINQISQGATVAGGNGGKGVAIITEFIN